MDGTGPHHPLTPRLADDVARSGQADSQLDRELESALGVEPSPEFLARVRTRVAAEPEVPMWRQALWGRGAQPAVAMALVSVLLAVAVSSVMRNVKRSAPHVTVAGHVDVPARERIEGPPVTRERAAVPVARQVEADVDVGLSKASAAVPVVPLQLSEPLFSDDERRAIFQFVVAVEEGRLPSVPAAEVEEQFSVTRKLIIEPLVIDPLPQLARVQKEGEGQW